MAKINQYPAKTVPSNNDEFVLHDPASGSTKKMTRGDLIGGAPLPANSVNGQAIADGSVNPAKRSGGFKVGTIPGSTFGSTGNKSITGVGFKPKYVEFEVIFSSSTTSLRTGKGWMDESGGQGMAATATNGSSVSSTALATARCIGWLSVGAATRVMGASFVSMDNDGFTINVNETASSFDVVYRAFG